MSEIMEAWLLAKAKYGLACDLKDEQYDIIKMLIQNKRNVIGILPTGFGKTLTFLLPPLILDEVSIIQGKTVGLIMLKRVG